MCEALPDIEPDSEASFPCVYAIRRVDTTQLAKVNHRNFDSHIAALAKTLERSVGSSMPIVIGQDMNVVNGIGRLQVAAEAKRKFVQCVQVTKAQEEFSSAMLNLLSMDFSMESSYADVLRYNSFMRERNTRETDTEATKPTVNPERLAEALDFEFDLPYPDGTTLGLADRARKVFEKRLGITLPGKEETGHGD